MVEGAVIARNRRWAVGLCVLAGVVPSLVLGVVLGLVVGVVAGAVAAIVLMALLAVGVWRASTTIALRRLRARPFEAGEAARLENVVEGLCATFGLRRPILMIVDDPVANACSLGRDPNGSVLVVTSGLLSGVGLMELEGLVAHELTHMKRHDTALAGVALSVLGPWGRLSGSDRLLHRVLGPGREYRADQMAVAVVRYPPGLHDGLATIVERSPTPGADSIFNERRMAATRWVWIDPDVGRRAGSDGDLDTSAVRVAALAEL
jgi:Peptidase family M48